MNCPGSCQVLGALRSLIYIEGQDYPGRGGYAGGDRSTVVNDTLQLWRDNEDSMWMGNGLDWTVSGVVEI
jgi:hypothetical protein